MARISRRKLSQVSCRRLLLPDHSKVQQRKRDSENRIDLLNPTTSAAGRRCVCCIPLRTTQLSACGIR